MISTVIIGVVSEKALVRRTEVLTFYKRRWILHRPWETRSSPEETSATIQIDTFNSPHWELVLLRMLWYCSALFYESHLKIAFLNWPIRGIVLTEWNVALNIFQLLAIVARKSLNRDLTMVGSDISRTREAEKVFYGAEENALAYVANHEVLKHNTQQFVFETTTSWELYTIVPLLCSSSCHVALVARSVLKVFFVTLSYPCRKFLRQEVQPLEKVKIAQEGGAPVVMLETYGYQNTVLTETCCVYISPSHLN